MWKIGYAIVVIALLLTGAAHPMRAQTNKTLTIFAASSLTDAFKEIASGFKAKNPGVEVVFNFGASSTLATQLKEGAPADVFASANIKQMDLVREAKRIAGKPNAFAKNRLILIVPADNPAKIAALRDLAKPGIKLVVAAPSVPVRDYTNTMLERMAKSADYGEAYKAAVIKNFVSEENNVRQVAVKVGLGEADAGIVYQSDVTPDLAAKVKALPIPDALNTVATYPIGVTDNSQNAAVAKAFVEYVLSGAGQDTLTKWGFISVRIPELPPTVKVVSDKALHVGGQVLNPLALTVEMLRQNYAAQTATITYLGSTGEVKAAFKGVLLRDILDSVQVNFNENVMDDKLGMYIVATGGDGFQSVISWAEIDADFANQPILVAYEQDGKPIADPHGPLRLVVPGDKRGGRYVGNLASLEVRHAPPISR